VMQAERPEQRAVLRHDRNGPRGVQSVLQRHPSVLLRGAGPQRVGGDGRGNHALLAECGGAARSNGRADRQWRNELLVVVRNPPTGGRPQMLAIGVRQQDAGDDVRIECVDAVAERAEDVLKGSAVDDQLERSLMNRGQRIANAWRRER